MPLFANPTGTRTPAFPGGIGDDELAEITSDLDATDVFGEQGTICRTSGWRIDRQKPSPTSVNIQVQKNGVGPPSTIACVLVPRSLYRANPNQPGHLNQVRYDAQMAELTRIIRRALVNSARSHGAAGPGAYTIAVYEVSGAFSN